MLGLFLFMGSLRKVETGAGSNYQSRNYLRLWTADGVRDFW